MILTTAQQTVMNRAIATADSVLPRLLWYEAVAEEYPGIQEQAQQLRTFREWLKKVSLRAIDANAQLESGQLG